MHDVVLGVYVVASDDYHAPDGCSLDGRLALCRLWSSALFSLSFFSSRTLSISLCAASNRRCCAMLVNCFCSMLWTLSFMLLLYLIYRRCQGVNFNLFWLFSLTRWLADSHQSTLLGRVRIRHHHDGRPIHLHRSLLRPYLSPQRSRIWLTPRCTPKPSYRFCPYVMATKALKGLWCCLV